ncbi:PREDICTED: geraniol 8-hydroxylase-like [Nicotiana attenuata]|uniref:geraniol 8-hydroxylase-like n=1 Tax=Nicotiana attenuata TaxID=49451 RepID=UPI000904CD70|nr:PREDICTED: geraniol 8-hydroxylase-like [Nicotiana attenuata]
MALDLKGGVGATVTVKGVATSTSSGVAVVAGAVTSISNGTDAATSTSTGGCICTTICVSVTAGSSRSNCVWEDRYSAEVAANFHHKARKRLADAFSDARKKNKRPGNKLDVSEHLRSKKIQELIDFCHKSANNGEAVNIGRAAFRTSLNLLSNTIFFKDLTDPFSDSAKEFKDLVWNIMVEAGKPNLVDYFPFLEKIDPQRIRQRMTDHLTKVLDLMSGLIELRVSKV